MKKALAGARFAVPLLLLLSAGCREPLPTTPDVPVGPESLFVGVAGRFDVVSRPGRPERVAYIVNWQDGGQDTSGFARAGNPVTFRHAWSDTGRFPVTARALSEDGHLSDVSGPRVVHVYWTNDPPDVPDDSGPDTLALGQNGQFRARSADPDGDLITYIFNWGDGRQVEYGPYASGSYCRVLNSWSEPGWLLIRLRVRDEHGAESGWSAGRPVLILP